MPPLSITFSATGWAALRFRSQRADYYEYLADILEATQGRTTIKRILASDAQRHGTRSPRGVLAAHWSHRIQDTGDLAMACAGTLPPRDLALLGLLQRTGGDTLAGGLRDLAALTRLDTRIRQLLLGTTALGVASTLICLAMLAATALFTAPTLAATFADVPTALHGPATRKLFGLADGLTRHAWAVAILGLLVVGAVMASLSRLRGRLRTWLERWTPVYGLYRDTQAIRLLVTLATLIHHRGAHNIGLAAALALVRQQASPWLEWHLDRMADRLSQGQTGATVFDTGLLDMQVYGYLDDLSVALGLEQALQRARTRLEQRTLAAVQRRAVLAQWVLMLGAIASLVVMMLWHYAAIFELRSAMSLSLSS